MNQKKATEKTLPSLQVNSHQPFRFSWDVYKDNIVTANGIKIPNKKAIIRNDTDRILNVVSDRYQPFYNNQFESIINAYEQVGCNNVKLKEFSGGGKLSVQMQNNSIGAEALTEQILTDNEIKIDDKHKGYVTLINSHDGSCKWMVGLTIVRIVCHNTYLMAIRDLSQGQAIFSGKHLSGSEKIWNNIEASIVSASNTMKDYMFIMEKLKESKWDPSYNWKFFTSTFTTKKGLAKAEASSRMTNLFWDFDLAYNRYQKEMGGNTKYTIFNAVTHVVDHNASKKQVNNGWNAIGRGNAIKTRALSNLFN